MIICKIFLRVLCLYEKFQLLKTVIFRQELTLSLQKNSNLQKTVTK